MAQNDSLLAEAAFLFFGLSFLSFGGTISLLPDLHRFLVESRGVMTSTQFSQYVALAQAAPGPNILYIALFGYHIAGWAGAFIALGAISAGPVALMLLVGRIDTALKDHPWREIVLRGLAPVSVGLLVIGVWTLTKPFGQWRAWALCAVAFFIFLKTKAHPILVFAVAAVVGVVLKL